MFNRRTDADRFTLVASQRLPREPRTGRTRWAGPALMTSCAVMGCIGGGGATSNTSSVSGSWSGSCTVTAQTWTDRVSFAFDADSSGRMSGSLTDELSGKRGTVSGNVAGSSISGSYTYADGTGGTVTGTAASAADGGMSLQGTLTTGGQQAKISCSFVRRAAADAGASSNTPPGGDTESGRTAAAAVICSRTASCSATAVSASEIALCEQMMGDVFDLVPDPVYFADCAGRLSCTDLQNAPSVQACLDLDGASVSCNGPVLHGCTRTSGRCSDVDCPTACNAVGATYDHCGFDGTKGRNVCWCVAGASGSGPDAGALIPEWPPQDAGNADPTGWDAAWANPTTPGLQDAASPQKEAGIAPLPPCARVGLLKTTNALDIATRENTIYIADGSAGLKIADVSNPFAPSVVGALAAPGGAIVAVAVAGNYLYAYDPVAGLLVIDTTRPTAPTLAANAPLAEPTSGIPTPPSGDEGGIAVSGNRVYIGGAFSAGVCSFDISTPTAPTRVGTCATDISWASNFVAQADLVYAVSPFSFLVINVANPSGPLTIGTYAAEQGSLGGSFGWFGAFALVPGMPNSTVVDLSVPTAPRAVGMLEERASAATVSGHYGLLAAERELRFVALDNPSAPRVVGSCQSAEYATSRNRLVATEQRAYLSLGDGGVSVWQLSPERLTTEGDAQ